MTPQDSVSTAPSVQLNDPHILQLYVQDLAGHEQDLPDYLFEDASQHETFAQYWRFVVEVREDILQNVKLILFGPGDPSHPFSGWVPEQTSEWLPKQQFIVYLSLLSWIETHSPEKYAEAPPSSTTYLPSSETVEQELRRLFAAACDEIFEDGMESVFSRGLVSLIKKYGNAAVETVTNFIAGEVVNPEVASEALRWLGHIDDPFTYRNRLLLLERSLWHSSARVRDGAILGLASLDDPSAIPYLEEAIEREQIQELRRYMIQVLDQLKNTQREKT
jgi:hypothetical protein